MGLSNMQDYQGRRDNFIKSPQALGSDNGMMVNQGAKSQPRVRPKKRQDDPHIESIDNDSFDSIGQADYNQLLPTVKNKKNPRKKRSPSNNSAHNSSLEMPSNANRSISRISASGMKEHKLRATLNQSLQFKETSVKVPVK